MSSFLFFTALLLCSTLLHPTSAQYGTIDGHSCFRNLDGHMQTMFDLARDYPNLVSVKDIGDSYIKTTGKSNDFGVEGYDIYAMKITSSDGGISSADKGKTLITSGLHSREYAPPELAMRFAESLINGYLVDPDITWILQHVEVHFIIHVNPDGRYVAENDKGIYWRKNLNDEGGCSSDEDYGVDINRNFDFKWGDKDGASNDPCDSDYHGPFPESEPETKAVSQYARDLFPEGQRRSDPLNQAAGEDTVGMYVDIHASGGYIYFPWGHENKRSPDDDALQALGRKVQYYNNYDLWAPGSPDFQYTAAGDASDYMYGALSTASFGLELGEDFYESCNNFPEIVRINLPGLLYAAKISKQPFSLVKGPDIVDLSVPSPTLSLFSGEMVVSVQASDSQRAAGQSTGDQGVSSVQLYLDVHPDDYQLGRDTTWTMSLKSSNSGVYTFETEINFDAAEIAVPSQRITSGRHILYAQAKDSDGYKGPVSSLFIDVEKSDTSSPTPRPSRFPTRNPTRFPSRFPTRFPTRLPTSQPITPTKAPITPFPISKTSSTPTKLPSNQPSKNPSSSPVTVEPTAKPTLRPTTDSPSSAPSKSPSISPVNLPTTSNPTLRSTSAPSQKSISSEAPTSQTLPLDVTNTQNEVVLDISDENSSSAVSSRSITVVASMGMIVLYVL